MLVKIKDEVYLCFHLFGGKMKTNRTQKSFLAALGLFLIYGIFSRSVGFIASDENEIIFKKVLKLVAGISFILILLRLYFQQKSNKNEP
ncbi:hypothetical protein [Flexithrix dorotheae]|uniref:hypothetical protein n=1 Tax=Flexithrix dorotheae TaxID=70993 RepID=UPI00037B08B4|nr:hypothetical protein [Flexithrix dorotheae]